MDGGSRYTVRQYVGGQRRLETQREITETSVGGCWFSINASGFFLTFGVSERKSSLVGGAGDGHGCGAGEALPLGGVRRRHGGMGVN